MCVCLVEERSLGKGSFIHISIQQYKKCISEKMVLLSVCEGIGRERGESEREQTKLQWFDFQPFVMCILVACNP